MAKIKHIVCFHLLNDYSGSPKILYQTLGELLKRGHHIDLATSRGGVLDTLESNEQLRIYHYSYQFSNNPAIIMLRYGLTQLYTFLFAFRYLFKRNTVFYINTLLPVGPALAGKLMGKQIVYHYHENASTKGFFYKSLSRIMQLLASKIICVSVYQQSFLKRKKNVIVIPNVLPQHFYDAFKETEGRALPEKKIVLMLSSLKEYKGSQEFIILAQHLPQYRFCLVINDTYDNINSFLTERHIEIPSNLEIYDQQKDIIPFFRKASLVLNLSDKNRFIETFGLTALEAMTAALPVIVPTVGGIAEMVENDVNGYKIDVQDLDKIKLKIEKIFSENELYHSLSFQAKQRSKMFDVNEFNKKICSLFK